jgi:hypothetical protein
MSDQRQMRAGTASSGPNAHCAPVARFLVRGSVRLAGSGRFGAVRSAIPSGTQRSLWPPGMARVPGARIGTRSREQAVRQQRMFPGRIAQCGLGRMRKALCEGYGLPGLGVFERWLHVVDIALGQSVRLGDAAPVCGRLCDLGENG